MQNLLQPASHSDTHSHEKACPMRILLINTGGTIGMAETRHGFAPRDGVIEAAIAQLTEQGATTAQIDVMTKGGPRDSTQSIVYQAVERGYRQQDIAAGSAISVVLFLLVLCISLTQRYLTREKQ